MVTGMGFDHGADALVKLASQSEGETFIGDIPVQAVAEPQFVVVPFDEFGQSIPGGRLAGLRYCITGRLGEQAGEVTPIAAA